GGLNDGGLVGRGNRILFGALRLGGGLGTGLALGLLLGQFSFLPGLALLETFPGPIGLFLLFPFPADFRLGVAIVLHKRNAAGTHVRAGAAFDAVHQVELLGLVQLVGAGEPVKLL